jgi:PPE-repeat protein
MPQNIPDIAQLEAHYGEMWAQDATAQRELDGTVSTIVNPANILFAISYLVGVGLVIVSIAKLKAHKDNPQQTSAPIPVRGTETGDLTLLNQFSASHLNASNGSLSDTLISDPNKSVTDASPLFAHTG